jgi:hypothetical protein
LFSWLEFLVYDRPLYVYDDLGEMRRVQESAFASTSTEPDAKIIEPERLTRQGREYLRLRRRAFSRGYHVFVAVAMAFFAAGALFSGFALRVAGFPLLSWIALPASAVCIVVAVLNPAWMKRQAAWRSRILFGAGTACYACGYELKNLTPNSDGTTSCPECGAAWRLPSASRGSPDERDL